MRDDRGDSTRGRRRWLVALALALLSAVAVCVGATRTNAATVGQPAAASNPAPTVTWAAAHDVSPTLRDLAAGRIAPDAENPADQPELGPVSAQDNRHSNDGALQAALPAATIPAPQQNFEGLSNQDNFNTFGFRVNPPDPTVRWVRTTTSR